MNVAKQPINDHGRKQLTLRGGDEPELPGGSEDENLSWLWSKGEVTGRNRGGLYLPWRALKVKGGARNQVMWAASRSRKRQGTRFSPELPENNAALLAP